MGVYEEEMKVVIGNLTIKQLINLCKINVDRGTPCKDCELFYRIRDNEPYGQCVITRYMPYELENYIEIEEVEI